MKSHPTMLGGCSESPGAVAPGLRVRGNPGKKPLGSSSSSSSAFGIIWSFEDFKRAISSKLLANSY